MFNKTNVFVIEDLSISIALEMKTSLGSQPQKICIGRSEIVHLICSMEIIFTKPG